jgi:hypothetical protein
MKYVIQGLAVIVLIGLVLWMLWPKDDPVVGSVNAGTVAPAGPLPGADIAPPDPAKSVDTMDPALRARLLAALAARVALNQQRRVTPDATVSEPPPPRSPEWKRELKGYLKSTTRELQPLVLGCVAKALDEKPELGTAGNSVKISMQGSPGLGTVVSEIELSGPSGKLEAPGLRSCIEEKTFYLRMNAAPPVGTDEGGPTSITFPLMIPGR